MAKHDRICVGAIAGAFGVRGEVRLKSFCATPDAIAGYGPLWTEDGSRSFSVSIVGPVAGGLAARLSGVDGRDAAANLRGVRLYADRTALPALPDDEYYHADLLGMTVQDTGGRILGKVSAVHDHGAGDMLEVSGAALAEPVLVPFTRSVVPTVDIAAGRIVIDPPEGLFE